MVSDYLGALEPKDLRQRLIPPRGFVYSHTHIHVGRLMRSTAVSVDPYWRNADGHYWYTNLPSWPLTVELSGRDPRFSAMLRDISLTLANGAAALREHGC